MNEKIYWIWLQNALKYADTRVRDVLVEFGNAKKIYKAGEESWRLCGIFTNKEISALKNSDIKKAITIFDRCDFLGYYVVTPNCEGYPKILKNIENPPAVIYVKGSIKSLNKNAIAVVGTRNASDYAIETGFKIAYDLAKSDFIIISGGALGVDTTAHKGAIEAGRETIAVLGCGLNYPYLMENSPLRNKISKNGAVISEYPPDAPAFMSNFTLRNRIIVGLSKATVVVEAGERSGSLNTANITKKQGKDVFALPVDMRRPSAKGIVYLIKSGAKIVNSASEILKKLGENNYFKANTYISEEKIIENENFSGDAKNVLNALRFGKMHVDEISEKTKIEIQNLLSTITELEILGAIKSLGGQFYETI